MFRVSGTTATDTATLPIGDTKGGETGMTVDRMIELMEIERECVLRNSCGDCNRYCAECDLLQDDTELHEMYTEAIAMLKAHEPHVMTLEEYEAWIDTPFTERNPVFHEERTKRGTVTCWVNTVVCTLREYGKNDRCWTSRPDQATMEAIPWNAQN